MKEQPMVSIICPVYNHEKFIAGCIESARNQTFGDWEMIIVNDGSTDRTAEIIEPFIQLDERIHLYNQDNIGIFRLAETYNKALQLSQGKYIAVLEGDDLWEPDKLERQVKIMESDPGVVLAWGTPYKLYESSGMIDPVFPFSIKEDVFNNDPPGMILRSLFFENPIPALSLLIRKDILIHSGGFHQDFHLPLVDLPTIFNIVPYGRFYFDQKLLGTWRATWDQVTKTYPVEILQGRWDLSRHYFNKYNQDYHELVPVSLKEIDRYFSDRLLITYTRSGRYKLIRKDFKGARQDYRKAIFFPGIRKPIWRLRALTGLLFSYPGWDVEGLSRVLGRVSYKERDA